MLIHEPQLYHFDRIDVPGLLYLCDGAVAGDDAAAAGRVGGRADGGVFTI